MTLDRDPDEYRVRFRLAADLSEQQVCATAYHRERIIQLWLPDGSCTAMGVTTARAICMVLHAAVFTSLEPSGPYLRVESKAAGRWGAAGPVG